MDIAVMFIEVLHDFLQLRVLAASHPCFWLKLFDHLFGSCNQLALNTYLSIQACEII